MGILELHLHEPEFNVGPRTGGSSATESLQKEASQMMRDEDEAEDGGGSMGAIVALVVLVVAAVAIRRFRSSGDGEAYERGREEMPEVGK